MIAEKIPVPIKLRETRKRLLATCRPEKNIMPNFVKNLDLCLDGNQINGIQSRSVQPHIDFDFPPWTALWVIRSNRHTLHVADYKPRKLLDRYDVKKIKKKVFQLPLRTGRCVLFDSHHVHWLETTFQDDEDIGLIAAIYDFKKKPTAKEVVYRLAGRI